MKHSILILSCLAGLVACKTNDFNGGSNRAPAQLPIQSRDFLQETREIRNVQLKQGTSGSKGNEQYNVVAMGIVDIVVVVDTSGSMAEEQANLASRLTPLLSAIKESDWRIVVTTTDPADRCGYGPISKGDFMAESRFKSLVSAGTGGTGVERPILRAVDALKGTCLFGPGRWLRPNSTVAVVILTDEDNCHIDVAQGYGCAGAPDKDGAYLTNYLSTIRKVGTEARVYGIFWGPTQTQAQCPSALKSANIIADVVTKTGGTWGSICDADYSATLTKISTDVAKILKADFVLKSIPDPGTFKMTVNGQPWTAFTQVGVNVHFTTNPPVGAAVQVSYVSGAAGVVSNSFPMPEAPVDGVVTGTVNGRPGGAVTYDANAKKAVFAQTPADGSVVILSYKVPSPLKTVFEIVPAAELKSIKVMVNGAVVSPDKYKYDSNTGAITFAEAPPESAKIHVEWRGTKKTS